MYLDGLVRRRDIIRPLRIKSSRLYSAILSPAIGLYLSVARGNPFLSHDESANIWRSLIELRQIVCRFETLADTRPANGREPFRARKVACANVAQGSRRCGEVFPRARLGDTDQWTGCPVDALAWWPRVSGKRSRDIDPSVPWARFSGLTVCACLRWLISFSTGRNSASGTGRLNR